MKQAEQFGSTLISAKNIPSFLIEAENAVNVGDNKKAKSILTEKAGNMICAIPDKGSRILSLYIFCTLLFKIGEMEEAEKWNKTILGYGEYAFAYHELNRIYFEKCDFVTASEFGKKALSLEPDDPKLLCMLGQELVNLGQTGEGIELLQKAVAIAPEDKRAGDLLLYYLHYLPNVTPDIIFNTHKNWAKAHAPIAAEDLKFQNSPEPDRKLRIGYVSPNFNQHSVAYFFESLLECHNEEAFEIFGYYNSKKRDKVTARMQPKFTKFSDIYKLTDEQVSKIIKNNKIDILVDLAGHTADNRLSLFANKPAPIQITWLGYPDTTGMSQIDYRITDELADPPASHKYYTEKQIRLPDGFLCYKPPEFSPPVSHSPFLKNGFITFGSFNINAKVNKAVIQLWAQILKKVENSHLLLKLRGGEHNQMQNYYHNYFEQLGIKRNRVEIHGRKSSSEHLEMYGEIDIALDTFPYHGTTTTCEALWMGVPVISLIGNLHCSRVALSILKRLYMEFFTAHTKQEYITKACALAANKASLAKIRQTMRQRFSASDLCNKAKFSNNIENVYRQIWKKWCTDR